MKILRYKLTCILLLMACMATGLKAQTDDAQSGMLRRRAAEKVAQFNDYVAFIGSKKKPMATRQAYRTRALNLFCGRGNAYTEYLDNNTSVEREGVSMQTTSVNRPGRPTTSLMRDYLTRLSRLNYTDVQISSTDIANIQVSNLQKVDDNLYVCTCYFEQAFTGYRDGVPVYKDITRKRIKCYVYQEETVDGTEYIVLLGDATATDTYKG